MGQKQRTSSELRLRTCDSHRLERKLALQSSAFLHVREQIDGSRGRLVSQDDTDLVRQAIVMQLHSFVDD